MAFKIDKELLDNKVKQIKQIIKNNPNSPLNNMSDYLIRKHVEKDLINDQRLMNGLNKKTLVKPISKIINTEVIRNGKTEKVKMRVEEDYIETTCGNCKKKFNYLKDRKRPRLFCNKYCSSEFNYKTFQKRKERNEKLGLPVSTKKKHKTKEEIHAERVEYFRNISDEHIQQLHYKVIRKIDKKYGAGLDKRLSDIHMREMKESDPERYEKHLKQIAYLKRNWDEAHYKRYGEHLYEEFE